MIITKLQGGLGNQMFQYAAGRSLANRHNTQLKIDISKFRYSKHREYNLIPFNIIENLASKNDLLRIKMPSSAIGNLLVNINLTFSGNQPIDFKKESVFHFDSDFLNLHDNVYLEGYWQSEKYFKSIEGIIRNEFSIKIPPDPINQNFITDVLKCNSVSLHIRRGDYISDPKAMKIHGVLGIDYYSEALERIEQKVNCPKIFVFSDNIQWAMDNLKTNLPLQFIDHNKGDKSFEDLRIMSNCKHHIIANSSFSWWGAWLCSNPAKIVISPRKWFNQSTNDTKDLCPDMWIKI